MKDLVHRGNELKSGLYINHFMKREGKIEYVQITHDNSEKLDCTCAGTRWVNFGPVFLQYMLYTYLFIQTWTVSTDVNAKTADDETCSW